MMDRRTFIKTVAVAVAGTVLAPLPVPAGERPVSYRVCEDEQGITVLFSQPLNEVRFSMIPDSITFPVAEYWDGSRWVPMRREF